MNTRRCTVILAGFILASSAAAQTSSIGKRRAITKPAGIKAEDDPRTEKTIKGNPTLEKHSLTAVRVKPPRKYRVHDLVTIIIREQRRFKADSGLESQKEFAIRSQIMKAFKFDQQKLVPATFSAGMPDLDFSVDSEMSNEATKDRIDRFTARVTGEIIDIKPNGNLVVQAKGKLTFDDEVTIVTLTGVVRNEDVTPDNTVLSTQLSDKVLDVQNEGAVRDGTRRGWIPRILDYLKPF